MISDTSTSDAGVAGWCLWCHSQGRSWRGHLETKAWLETLAGPNLNWLRALVTSKTVVRGSAYVGNALQRLLAPRRVQTVVVKYAGSVPASVTLYCSARSYGPHIDKFTSTNSRLSRSSTMPPPRRSTSRSSRSAAVFRSLSPSSPSTGLAGFQPNPRGRRGSQRPDQGVLLEAVVR